MENTNIYAKLMKIQSALNCPKSQYNAFGKYKYRKAEDILEAVKPLLKENGCALVCTDELQLIGDRYYVKATATLFDTSILDDKVSTTAYAREEVTKTGMDASQITGASSSYARKYALNGLFCIDDTADSDTTNVGPQPEPAAAPAPKPKPARKPAARQNPSALSRMSKENYDTLVMKVATDALTKDGRPAFEYVLSLEPTDEERKAFNEAVIDYKINHNLP